jgi:molecular chaperone GrpE
MAKKPKADIQNEEKEAAIEKETLENAELNEELQKKIQELENMEDSYKRLVAEFDNFKKRTVKEKEAIYTDSVCDVITEILPILDNLDRALESFEDKENEYYKGVELVKRQTSEIFQKIGIEEVEAVGKTFDPALHNAIMHIEDENLSENTISMEFQKGYKYKDKVIRYSMVQVAN